MSLVTKPDFNLIFASQAPSVDLPPQFNNYVRGMDETRKNNGKPTIKQFNYLHQNLDLKLLWILQNGAALPYDSSIEYVENSLAVKDGELQQFVDGVWSPFKKTVNASDVKDESGKNQQQINDVINSKYVSVNNYDSMLDALSSVQTSDATLLLDSGATYTVDSANLVFFSQIESIGQRATVVITERTKLSTFGKDLILKNVNIIQLGKRVGVNDSSTSASFLYDFTMPSIDMMDIQDVNVYALTNQEDLSSFVDDVGKTRCAGFINVKINKRSRLNNINHYGFSKFANIEPTTYGAIHDENSVIGYNCETSLYFRDSTIEWKLGSSENIGIKNTATNKTYWVGQSVGILTNGKNSLLIGAEHATPVRLNNIWAEYAIEKSLYNQSKQSNVTNVFDTGTLQVGQVKHSKSDMEGVANFSGIRALNPTVLTGLIAVNGYAEYNLSDVIVGNSVKNKARIFVVRNLNFCDMSNMTFKNLGTLIVANGDEPIYKLVVRNVELFDCYNSDAAGYFWRFQPEVATYLITDLWFDNINSSLSSSVASSAIHAIGFQLDNVKNTRITGSNLHCKSIPIKSFSQNESIIVEDTKFTIKGIINCYNSLNYLNLAENNFKASLFDMSLEVYPVDTIVKTVNINLQKNVDTGLVYCYPYWKSINLDATITAVSSTNIVPIASTEAFKIIATSDTSRIELVVDMSTKTNNVISNIGTVFSETKADNKICLSVDSSNRLNIDVGNSLTWTQGAKDLSITLSK